jgi:hypothetical protein
MIRERAGTIKNRAAEIANDLTTAHGKGNVVAELKEPM